MKKLFTLFLGFYSFSFAFGQTVMYVDSSVAASQGGLSWSNAFKTLGEALDAAGSNSAIQQIWVKKGTYYPDEGNGRTNNRRDLFFSLRNDMAIYGGFAGGEVSMAQRDWRSNATILSGEIQQDNNKSNNSLHVIRTNGLNTTAVLDGFTIIAGNASNDGGSGSAIGGGMYNNNSSPSVVNCSFLSNTASDGGGMYNYYSSPSVVNCSFSSNTATHAYGGGIYNNNSSPSIVNCSFSSNNAGSGGGIYNDYSSPSITNCSFSSNNAGSGGGGMYNSGYSLSVVDCSFLSNTASEGGGMYNYYCAASVVNCNFSSNNAGSGGGVKNIFSPASFANCSFASNKANAGGGMHSSGSNPISLVNCILWGNTNGQIVNAFYSNPTVTYSIVQGGYTGEGNLDADPVFADTSHPAGTDGIFGTSDDGLRLKPGSPAVNKGSNDAVPNTINTDITGDDRIQRGVVDMGAYETSFPVFFSKPTGNLNNILTWGVNTDGSGLIPPDFGAGKVFYLSNRTTYTMTANWTVGGVISIPPDSRLQLNGFTLSEAGLVCSGTLSGSPTSNLIITGSAGGDAGSLLFTPNANQLNNLTLNRTGTAASTSIGSPLNLYGVLSVTSPATLATSDSLTLKSTETGTARVAPVSGTISGAVTVERYIPARRAWRILAAPVSGSQSLNAAWQEGAATTTDNPSPGYGTFITGGTQAQGFDQNSGASSSIKTYSSSLNNWVAAPNTNTTAVNANAYMTFVYGNRNTNTIGTSSAATPTTLKATGPLKTGDQTFSVSITSGFTAIPNPFASPINFTNITRNNVQNNFYVWDPRLGGANGVGAYVSVSWNGTSYDVSPAPVSPVSELIQSGQGFLVRATAGVIRSASITIKESDKSATAAQNVFRTGGGDQSSSPFQDPGSGQGLRVSLQAADTAQSTAVLDEVFASYKADYSAQLDGMDAVKAANMRENLAIAREGQMLVIERKPLLAGNDTLSLQLWNMEAKRYMLQVRPVNIAGAGLWAYLEDRYLRKLTPVSLREVSDHSFAITADAASAQPDRFRLIMSKDSRLSEVLSNRSAISVYPNPVVGRSVRLLFENQAAGIYVVRVVNNAGQVVMEKQVQHGGGSAVQNLQLGRQLASGVYQLQVSGRQGVTSMQILCQ